MISNLESNYDCSQAGNDLKQLLDELTTLRNAGPSLDKEAHDRLNRLENQIHFIKTKCDIRP
jgi:hypothetical protein